MPLILFQIPECLQPLEHLGIGDDGGAFASSARLGFFEPLMDAIAKRDGEGLLLRSQIDLLAGIIANSKNPAAYRITGEALGSEPIALLFRKDDPSFKAAVDESLRKLMKSGELEKIYTKWFVAAIPPKNTSLNLPMSPALKQLLLEPNDKPLEAYAK